MVSDAIRSVDRTVPVFGAKTMRERLSDALARPRFYRNAAVLFSVFAWLVTLIGIFASVSYSVTQRMTELGIRLALGTTPHHLRGRLLQQGLIVVGFAAACGIAAAMLASRFLASLVEGASSVDVWTVACSVLVIIAAASASIWIATRPILLLLKVLSSVTDQYSVVVFEYYVAVFMEMMMMEWMDIGFVYYNIFVYNSSCRCVFQA
jgi:ABC-type lipoprotein release transport system permease subunit